MMANRAHIHIPVLLLVTIGSGCALMNLRPQLDVTDYRGEGAISQIRSAENLGFKVDFGPFSLAKPYAFRYRLEGLPRAHGVTPYEAGLVAPLDGAEESEWPHVPERLVHGALGGLVVKLEDAAGATLFEGTAEIGGLSWTRFINDSPFGHTPAWRYRPDLNGRVSEQPWYLAVSYTPGVDSIDRPARIRFTAGGRH